MKPKVFIGSSSEGLKIANAIHANLTREAECTVWNQGIFALTQSTLTDLIRVLRDSDFGVFVFSPDDVSVMRDTLSNTVRDNVLFELGLFIGRLGPERSFFLIPDNVRDLRLPSDLAGRQPGIYEGDRTDGNWVAATSPVCMQISYQLSQLKAFQDAAVAEPRRRNSKATTGSRSAAKGPAKPASMPVSGSTGEGIEAWNYKKMILLLGNTKPAKEVIKSLDGRWISSLGGWTIKPDKMSSLLVHLPKIDYKNEEWVPGE